MQVVKMRASYGSNVKFVLMNSFSTSDDSLAHLREAFPELAAEADVELLQNKCPKVDASNMEVRSSPKHTYTIRIVEPDIFGKFQR